MSGARCVSSRRLLLSPRAGAGQPRGRLLGWRERPRVPRPRGAFLIDAEPLQQAVALHPKAQSEESPGRPRQTRARRGRWSDSELRPGDLQRHAVEELLPTPVSGAGRRRHLPRGRRRHPARRIRGGRLRQEAQVPADRLLARVTNSKEHPMKKLIVAAAGIAALTPAGLASARSDATAHAAATLDSVRGKEFSFTVAKKSIPTPRTVTFTFRNVGTTQHDF